MREGKGKQEKIICNRCGKKLDVKDGIAREGFFHGEICWGYFSKKDGEKHLFDLCEDCYDKLVGSFAVDVTIEEKTELL